MQTTISILIPAYNAEKTIKRTLDSILNQTLLPFEIVIVNDGSTDKTQDILNEYENNKLFKIIEQSNAGVAISRQVLIENSTGEYLLFCDADDYYERNTIETIERALEREKVDLLVFGYTLLKKNCTKTITKRKLSKGFYTKKEYKKHHIKGLTDLYYSSLWNKCLKRKLIIKYPRLYFQHTMEDVIFNVEYMNRVETIYVTEKELYIHDQRADSLTRGNKSDSIQNIEDAFSTYQYLYKVLKITYPDMILEEKQYIYRMLLDLCERAKEIESKETYLKIKYSTIFTEIETNLKYKRYYVISKLVVNKCIQFTKNIVKL